MATSHNYIEGTYSVRDISVLSFWVTERVGSLNEQETIIIEVCNKLSWRPNNLAVHCICNCKLVFYIWNKFSNWNEINYIIYTTL